NDPEWAKAIFGNEPELVSYTLYRAVPEGTGWKALTTIRNSSYLETYGLKASEVDRIHSEVPIPFSRIASEGQVAYSSTLLRGAPIITIGIAIQVAGEPAPYAAVMNLRSDNLLKLLGDEGGRGVVLAYLVDHDGRVVVHPSSRLVETRAQLGQV